MSFFPFCIPRAAGVESRPSAFVWDEEHLVEDVPPPLSITPEGKRMWNTQQQDRSSTETMETVSMFSSTESTLEQNLDVIEGNNDEDKDSRWHDVKVFGIILILVWFVLWPKYQQQSLTFSDENGARALEIPTLVRSAKALSTSTSRNPIQKVPAPSKNQSARRGDLKATEQALANFIQYKIPHGWWHATTQLVDEIRQSIVQGGATDELDVAEQAIADFVQNVVHSKIPRGWNAATHLVDHTSRNIVQKVVTLEETGDEFEAAQQAFIDFAENVAQTTIHPGWNAMTQHVNKTIQDLVLLHEGTGDELEASEQAFADFIRNLVQNSASHYWNAMIQRANQTRVAVSQNIETGFATLVDCRTRFGSTVHTAWQSKIAPAARRTWKALVIHPGLQLRSSLIENWQKRGKVQTFFRELFPNARLVIVDAWQTEISPHVRKTWNQTRAVLDQLPSFLHASNQTRV